MEKCTVENIDWKTWTPDEKGAGVIVFIIDDEHKKTVLIHKKTGLGAGKITAPGGKIEKNETAGEAAVRECQEEVSLTPLNAEKCAELFFHFTSGFKMLCDVFFSKAWKGEIAESIEAVPFWCGLDEIPIDKMWEDNKYWLSSALCGKKIRGYYIYDNDKIISQKTEEVKNFDE